LRIRSRILFCSSSGPLGQLSLRGPAHSCKFPRKSVDRRMPTHFIDGTQSLRLGSTCNLHVVDGLRIQCL
jgi:hypothetical protein